MLSRLVGVVPEPARQVAEAGTPTAAAGRVEDAMFGTSLPAHDDG